MALVIIGSLLPLAGTLVAAWGLAQTWRRFADEGFRDEPTRRLRAAIEWVHQRRGEALWLSLLRRQKRVVGAGAAMGQAGAFAARGHIGFAPLPTDSETTVIAALAERTEQLLRGFNVTPERVQEIADEVTRIGGSLTIEVERLERQSRRVAVGGLRWAAAGLGLVAIGLSIQLVGLITMTAQPAA